jgi:glutamate-1-semialdehyde 2,1-aminomutase
VRDLVPCAGPQGMVRWVKTGSEACAAAVRVARAATGREIVLTAGSGYHGWHDWIASTYADTTGVPRGLRSLVRTFRFNDVHAFERALLAGPPGSVAAVVLEPMRLEAPEPGFLEHLRTRTRRIGAALIFDETVLGLRLAPAGGQEAFGVVPDLAVYGKALGGGLPLACVVGPASWMRHARVVSSTFGGDALALAAASALLDVYAREPVVERITAAGASLRTVLVDGLQGLPLEVIGSPVHMVVRAAEAGGEPAVDRLRTECARRGVLLEPRAIYPSAALAAGQIDASLAAVTDACRVAREECHESVDAVRCASAACDSAGRAAG